MEYNEVRKIKKEAFFSESHGHITMRYHHWLRSALLLVLCLALLCGCSENSKPVKGTKEELRVVGTCDGYEIYYEELRYLVLAHKDIMENYYGEGIWDDAATAAQHLPELRETVLDNLKANYAVMSVADTFGISIEDEAITEAVQSMIDATVSEFGSRKQYLAALEEMYLTDHLVRFTYATSICQDEVIYAMKDLDLIIDNELDFLDYAYADGFCAVYHIYIENDEGDDIDANRSKAEEVRDMLLGGTDIKQLIGSAYNEDVYLVGTDPYYFTRGEYDERYEEAAFGLKIGGVSEVVETEDGFYVLVRQELDQNYLVKNVQELKQRYEYVQVEELVDECRDLLTVELNEYGQSLDFLAIK